MRKTNLLAKLLACSVLLWGAQANAAAVTADASIALASVDTTGTATIDFTTGIFFADALINDVSAFTQFDADFGLMSADASVSAGNAFASSMTMGDGGASSAMADGTGNGFGSSFASIDFLLGGTGEVTLTFEYSLSVDASMGEAADAVVTLSDSFGALDEAFLFGSAGDAASGTSGLLTLTYIVDGAAFGFLGFETVARAETGIEPVPLPAAAWLLGGGLLALFRFRRAS